MTDIDVEKLRHSQIEKVKEFLDNQKEVISYEILPDEWNKKIRVDIEGSIHINQSDLCEGILFFKIRRLTGNFYFHGRNISRTSIPNIIKGNIIFEGDYQDNHNKSEGIGNDEETGLDGLQALTTKTPTKQDVVKRIKAAIADSIDYNHDIDVQEILDAVKKEWDEKSKFQLRIEFPKRKTKDYNSDKAYIQCDIYVHEDDNEPIKFNAIQKAYYLMFILKKDGLIVDDVTKADWTLVKKIYTQLANRVEKTYITDKETGKETEYKQGVSKNLFTISSIRSYLSEIRDIIHGRISYKSIANEFAIEGYRGKPFGVARATDEMRAEIREKFGLD